MYTLGQAARATGRSKSTILRAIEKGHLQGRKNDAGRYQIDPLALREVFRGTPAKADAIAGEMVELRTRLAVAERLAEERLETISDLRARLDEERDERQKLLGLQLPGDERKPLGGNFFQRRFSSR